MIKLHSVSGVPGIQRGSIGLHLNTAGILMSMNSIGVDTCVEAGSVGLSGLSDVSGIFTSGKAPTFNGTKFVPTTPASSTPPSLTVYASGLVEVVAVLGSGVIANGQTADFFTWSGIDQSYDSLEIRGVARGQTSSQNTVGIAVFFNGDTTAGNYYMRRLMSTTDQDLNHLSVNTSYVAQIQSFLDDDAHSNGASVAPFHLWIADYASSGFRKHIMTLGTGCSTIEDGYVRPANFGCSWTNTAAINMISIRIADATNTFCSGTEMYLLGHKKVWAVTSGVFGGAAIINGRFA